MQHLNGPKQDVRPPAPGAGPTLPPLSGSGGIGGGTGYHPPPPPPPPRPSSNQGYHVAGTDQESDEVHSGDEDDEEGVRLGKRKRPLSVS